jgi:Ring finger domain
MGATVSVFSECMGDFSRHDEPRSRHSGAPRVGGAPPTGVAAGARPPQLRQRTTADKAGSACSTAPPSAGAAVALAPPPLVPDKNLVYDLVGEDEDVCPTCLESYADENPRILPECGHDAHLQCILVWNERSGSKFCPVCACVLKFENDSLLS